MCQWLVLQPRAGALSCVCVCFGCQYSTENLKNLAKCGKFLKIQIFYFFRVLLAIKLNSKTNLRSVIFWFRPSFPKKLPKNAVFSTFGGLKVPNTKIFFHALKTFIFCQLKLFSKIWKVEEHQRYRVQLFSSCNPWHQFSWPLQTFFSSAPISGWQELSEKV